MKIAVVGLWHQGIVAAACFADTGYSVIGVDENLDTISSLNDGKSPIYEPGLDELLQKGITSERLSFTSEYSEGVKEADVVCLMIDTPVNENDESDISVVYSAVDQIGKHTHGGALLYVTAQVPVGTCDAIAERIHHVNPLLGKVHIAYSPENLRLGQAIERFKEPPLPVVGAATDEAYEAVEKLFAPFKVEWKRLDLRTAEMTKHALNAYLAVTITFANELGNICDEVGANGEEVAKALRMEERVGKKAMLFPGLGFSGGTLARDMQTLRAFAREHDLEAPLLDGVWESNQSQNKAVVRKLTKLFGDLKDVRIGVLGLTYKPETSTLRRSASIEIIRDLTEAGAVVIAHDPKADRQELKKYENFTAVDAVDEIARDAQALVLITPWKDYKELDYAMLRGRMKEPAIFFDTANMLDAGEVEAAGFKYLDIGRGRS